MTFTPPFPAPSTPTERLIVSSGMVPTIAASPNTKQLVYAHGATLSYRCKIVCQHFHNTHFTDSYSVAWAHSWLPTGIGTVYSPGATILGTGDPGIEDGTMTLDPGDWLDITAPIVLYPGESYFANQAKAGTLSGQAITLKLYAEFEPL